MELLEKKSIQISGKDYFVKLSVRAMMSFEKLADKSISEIKTLEDRVLLFYSCFKACNPDASFDSFMDLVDDDPTAIGNFLNLYLAPTEEKKP
jgi:hypothetical protein